jgi:hypothetical protein
MNHTVRANEAEKVLGFVQYGPPVVLDLSTCIITGITVSLQAAFASLAEVQ